MRTSQETGTRARAGLFWTAPSPGAFVAASRCCSFVETASASPASLLTNERPPSRATRHLGSPRSVRHSQPQAKAGARRGRRAGATLLSRWSGASRPRRCGPTASRRRTGGAALAFCALLLWRRRGARAALSARFALLASVVSRPASEGLCRLHTGARTHNAALQGAPNFFLPPSRLRGALGRLGDVYVDVLCPF